MDERDYKAMNKDAQKDVKTMEAKEIKKIYDKLEPKKYSRLELNDFKGVVLTFDECFVTIQKVVDLELHNRKLQTELKEAREMIEVLENYPKFILDCINNGLPPLDLGGIKT
jgi:hypothetical protein